MIRNHGIKHVRGGRENGFTLIELLLVVVILGVLAAVVFPLFGDIHKNVEQTAFISDLRVFVDAANIYYTKENAYLEDASSGVVPTGFAPYIDTDVWERPTPIGGVWDTERDSYGVTSAMGVHFNGVTPPDDTYMLQLDDVYDDNDLTTGRFRKLATDRFYHIVVE